MEFLDLFIGSGWLGAIAVPINTALRGVQLEHILRSSGAAILVVEPEYLGHIRKLDRPTLPIRSIWVLDGVDEDEDCTWPISRLPEPGGEIPAAETRPSDPVAILYTSGTTGLSKGVCCPHAQYFWWGVNSASLLGIREKDVLLTCLPLFHTNALNAFYQALLTGATFVVEPRTSKDEIFSPRRRIESFMRSMNRKDHGGAGGGRPRCATLPATRGKRRGFALAVDRRRRERFRDQLRVLALGLKNRLRDRVGLLSGGQRQAVQPPDGNA